MSADAPAAEQAPDPYQQIIDELRGSQESLRGELASTRENLARVEGRLEATPAQEAPKERTRAELQKAVDDGIISETERDAVLERQQEARLERKLKAELRAEQEARAAAEIPTRSIQRYIDTFPDLNTDGSENRKRVTAAYTKLVAEGADPNAKATELWALERAFGPVDKLKDRTAERRESHQETGGASGGDETPPASEAWAKGLPARQVAVIKENIGPGKLYKSTDDAMFKGMIAQARKKAGVS